MSQKQLVIDITPAGSVKIEAVGCTGDECVKASEPLEIVLGGVSKRQEKPEFYAPAAQSTAQAIKRNF
jgi:hypothetical protein